MVPFTTFEYVSCCILFCFSLLGFLNILIISTIIQERPSASLKSLGASNILLISVCFNSIIISLFGLFVTLFNIIHGGFAFDAFWCEHVIATVLLLTDCTVILSVVALVFDLYLRLFWRIQLSQIQAIMISIFSWIFSGFAVSWQYFIDPAGHKEIMTLQSGNLICLIDFTNKSRQTIAALCLILGLVLSIIVFVGMVYTRVFLFYVTANRKQYMTNVRVPLGNNEKTLLFRSSIVFGSILLFWFPFLTKIVAEISTGEPVSSEYDCFCCLSFSFLNLSNLFMTFLHSASIRKKMYSVFRMAKKHQDKIEKMITEGALSAIQQEPYQPPHLNHVSAASSEGLELNNSELRELPSLSYRSFMFRCSPPSPGGEDVSVGISPTLQLTP